MARRPTLLSMSLIRTATACTWLSSASRSLVGENSLLIAFRSPFSLCNAVRRDTWPASTELFTACYGASGRRERGSYKVRESASIRPLVRCLLRTVPDCQGYRSCLFRHLSSTNSLCYLRSHCALRCWKRKGRRSLTCVEGKLSAGLTRATAEVHINYFLLSRVHWFLGKMIHGPYNSSNAPSRRLMHQ